MISTRQEKEQHILDLYNQGYNTRTIAQETHTSFRDIGAILKRAAQQKEVGQVQVERTSISTQAYRPFSQGKTALQVTIDLQIKADEAIEYQKEYWKLNQLDSLSQLYEELKEYKYKLKDISSNRAWQIRNQNIIESSRVTVVFENYYQCCGLSSLYTLHCLTSPECISARQSLDSVVEYRAKREFCIS